MRDSNRQPSPATNTEAQGPTANVQQEDGSEINAVAKRDSTEVQGRAARVHWMLILAVVLAAVAIWIQPDFSESGNGPAVGRQAPDMRLVDFRIESPSPPTPRQRDPITEDASSSAESPLERTEASPILGEGFAWRNFAFEDSKVTLLHFWATWCPPCRKELPELSELHDEFAQHAHFEFIAVSCEGFDDTSLATLRDRTLEFYDDNDIRIPTFADPTTEARRAVLRVMDQASFAYPTTVLIDRCGVVQAAWVGVPPGGVDTIRQKLVPLLESCPPPTEAQPSL